EAPSTGSMVKPHKLRLTSAVSKEPAGMVGLLRGISMTMAQSSCSHPNAADFVLLFHLKLGNISFSLSSRSRAPLCLKVATLLWAASRCSLKAYCLSENGRWD